MEDADLDNAATVRLLQRLTPAGIELVVVGGQAVNHWAETYMSRVQALEAGAPYASKDVDLLGTTDTVERCAQALGTKPLFPSRGHTTPNAGAVRYRDESGREQQLDFLRTLHGLGSERDIREMAIPFVKETPDGPLRFLVMHPLHCLISRVSNVGGLPGYSTDHAINQLRASIVCMREFLRDLLHEGKERAVLRLSEQLIQFSCHSQHARDVYLKHEVETFDAMLHDDPLLPAKFREERYPRVLRYITERRSRVARAVASRRTLKPHPPKL